MLTKAMEEATEEANGKKRSIDNDGEGNHRKTISVVADGAGGKPMWINCNCVCHGLQLGKPG
jgi:hypothetical protein